MQWLFRNYLKPVQAALPWYSRTEAKIDSTRCLQELWVRDRPLRIVHLY